MGKKPKKPQARDLKGENKARKEAEEAAMSMIVPFMYGLLREKTKMSKEDARKFCKEYEEILRKVIADTAEEISDGELENLLTALMQKYGVNPNMLNE